MTGVQTFALPIYPARFSDLGISGEAFASGEDLEAGDVMIDFNDAGGGNGTVDIFDEGEFAERHVGGTDFDHIPDDFKKVGVPEQLLDFFGHVSSRWRPGGIEAWQVRLTAGKFYEISLETGVSSISFPGNNREGPLLEFALSTLPYPLRRKARDERVAGGMRLSRFIWANSEQNTTDGQPFWNSITHFHRHH